MNDEVKSGKQVIEEFFSQIEDLEGLDENTVKLLLDLHSEGKLTDTNIQNALSELLQNELKKAEVSND
jgi:Glu-tRNA(Gln) amidotransferase subunit E-like FAD-binding protein